MTLRPTPPLLDADGRTTPATAFLLVHRGLRRDLDLLAALAGSGDRAALAERWQLFGRVLHDHHTAEDERLFPALGAAEPALAPVLAELDAQHAALGDALARVAAALAGADDAALRRALSGLSRDLDAHLRLEEEHLVPVMLRGGTGPRPQDARRAAGDPQLLRWIREGLDDAALWALGLPG